MPKNSFLMVVFSVFLAFPAHASDINWNNLSVEGTGGSSSQTDDTYGSNLPGVRKTVPQDGKVLYCQEIYDPLKKAEYKAQGKCDPSALRYDPNSGGTDVLTGRKSRITPQIFIRSND